MAAKFGLFVDEDHSKLPTIYWLHKLHKKPYKSRFIANSSSYTTTELSILLSSCLTAIKTMSLNIEILNKLKSRGFLASSLST